MASLRPGEAGMSVFEEVKRRLERWDMRLAVDEVAGQSRRMGGVGPVARRTGLAPVDPAGRIDPF